MLRSRVMTAVVLIPAVVVAVLYLPRQPLFGIFGLAVLIGGDELARLVGWHGRAARLSFAAALTAVLAALALLTVPQLERVLLIVVAVWWLLVSVYLLRGSARLPGLRVPGWLLLSGGALLLVTCWLALLALHRHAANGPMLVLSLLVLIWIADSGAYFTGKAWGRHKLAPAVSPGKTREGLAGALLGAVVMALLLFWGELLPRLSLFELVMLCLVVTVISVGGDLAESLLKRLSGVKDSGSLLPGHGGMLDRIDSLIAAAPSFVVGVRLFEDLL